MTSRDLTRDGLLRALADAAAARKAEAVAEAFADSGVEAGSRRRGPGDYVVRVTGPNLFARVHGSHDRGPDPLFGRTLDDLRRRR